MSDSDTLESSMRLTPKCVCGVEKPTGLIVCWACFKGHNGVTPLKYFTSPVGEWVKLAKQHWRGQ